MASPSSERDWIAAAERTAALVFAALTAFAVTAIVAGFGVGWLLDGDRARPLFTLGVMAVVLAPPLALLQLLALLWRRDRTLAGYAAGTLGAVVVGALLGMVS